MVLSGDERVLVIEGIQCSVDAWLEWGREWPRGRRWVSRRVPDGRCPIHSVPRLYAASKIRECRALLRRFGVRGRVRDRLIAAAD